MTASMLPVVLARAVKTTANTVSRWETATYKPSIADLEMLARFFGVPIAVFFPEAQPASRANALISATADLDDRDLEEVTLYARFRRHSDQNGKPEVTRLVQTLPGRPYVINSDILCHVF